jgi:TPR repeat protein
LVSLLFGTRKYIAVFLITLAALSGTAYYSHDKQQRAEAIALRAVADQGDAESQYRIAAHFEDGNGVSQSFDHAGDYYNRAAHQGHSGARARIAKAHEVCFDHSPRNLDEAHECQIDAHAGNANSQVAVAVLYDSGRLFKQNDVLAVLWYDLAAIQGDSRAQLMMARANAGRGLLPNPVEEYAWAATAAQRNDLPEDLRRNMLTLTRVLKEKLVANYGQDVADRAEAKARFYIQNYGKNDPKPKMHERNSNK